MNNFRSFFNLCLLNIVSCTPNLPSIFYEDFFLISDVMVKQIHVTLLIEMPPKSSNLSKRAILKRVIIDIESLS